MEQVKIQMNMADKLKRHAIIPLLAMGVLWGGLSSYTQADELDAQQVEQMLKVKVIGKLSQADKEEALKAFKENANNAKFPKEIIDLVTINTISDYELYKNYRLMYYKDGMCITQLKKNNKLTSFPAINRYDITSQDIAEPLPPLSNGINTVTKKPYFTIPKTLATNVSDKEYFKTLLKVMNTNFGTLMQMYTLDEKKVAKNGYAGKMADKAVLYFGENPILEEGMNETEITIRRQLGFIVNGAVDMIKAGGQLSIGAGDCTGWTVHCIDKKGNDTSVFVVFNGAKNSEATSYYRHGVVYTKAQLLKKMQANFHALMREHDVEPGTAVKNASLTTNDQRIFAYLGNTMDNYRMTLLKTKALGDDGPAEKDLGLKTLDKYAGKENATPVKTTAKKVSQRDSDKRTLKMADSNSRG
ncbi:hypothetical protein [Akkermansia sp.]|uniref:hypothetical protein n=1 Tax=Akkermansia sp. TaxID=1872421 RepID=UPI0025C1DB7A|nr:hypothetical protein [Akkermansia sp.]MCC8147743.1 hypothetical protein [Akkermansia sp.]